MMLQNPNLFTQIILPLKKDIFQMSRFLMLQSYAE